jgi:hypothetical protein
MISSKNSHDLNSATTPAFALEGLSKTIKRLSGQPVLQVTFEQASQI